MKGNTMKDWPTVVATFAAAAIGGCLKLGWITDTTAAALGSLVIPFTAFVHRLMPPGMAKP